MNKKREKLVKFVEERVKWQFDGLYKMTDEGYKDAIRMIAEQVADYVENLSPTQ